MGFLSGLINPSGSASKYNAAAMAYLDKAKKEAVDMLDPYTSQGAKGFTTLADVYGLNGADAQQGARSLYQTSPGYEWRLGQGIKAIDNAASARGMRGSGTTLKALNSYGQGVANQDYQDWVKGLAGIGTLGLTATGKAADVTTGAANNIAALLSKTGENKTNQSIMQGNLLGSLLGQAFSLGTGGGGGGISSFFGGGGGSNFGNVMQLPANLGSGTGGIY